MPHNLMLIASTSLPANATRNGCHDTEDRFHPNGNLLKACNSWKKHQKFITVCINLWKQPIGSFGSCVEVTCAMPALPDIKATYKMASIHLVNISKRSTQHLKTLRKRRLLTQSGSWEITQVLLLPRAHSGPDSQQELQLQWAMLMHT